MSRRSQAFSQGQPVFSWRIERVEQDNLGHATRFKASCRNHPTVFAFGDTEELALRAANHAMETAVDKVETTMVGPGQRLDVVAPKA